ncbi:CASP-like protein 4D1 [Miscanthus floridulus]|uniref:CASP-like protein 4D1 n=1 Tax=Miscanthus floridulus TaxID=154761 RepID=UPI0034594E29
MASRTVLVPSAVLILRLLALGLLAASLALIAADRLNVDSDPPQKYTFRDVYAYRYVLAVAVVGCAYTLLQLPLAAVSIARGKRSIGGTVAVALVLVLADVVFALLLATGAAAGFGFTYDVKRYLDGQFDDTIRTPEVDKLHRDMDRFFELAYASAGLMLAAAACMALVIMLSVYSLAK